MLDRLPNLLAAVRADMPQEDPNREDPRERLIRKLDRLVARIPKEERRAGLLAELAALDAEPPAPPDVPVAEGRSDDRPDRDQPASAEPVATG
jgi:hypothetical protein